MIKKGKVPLFKITNGKGFQMTFKNGVTISVQWGPGNYSDNYDKDFRPREQVIVESRTAEIAIWDRSHRWHDFEGDQVEGNLTPDEVSEWIHKVSQPDFEVTGWKPYFEKWE